MRPRTLLVLAVALATLAPAVVYEAVEKTSEVAGPRSSIQVMSVRADIEEPWRPKTGQLVLDRALHELGEARRFYRMVGRSLARRIH